MADHNGGFVPKNRLKLDSMEENDLTFEKTLFPTVLGFRFDYKRFLKIAVHEGGVHQALLRDHYKVGGSSTVRNALQKLSGVGLLSKPRRISSGRGRRAKVYQLTPKGLLLALLNPDVQAKTEVTNFFLKIGDPQNMLMKTLKISNWLTHPKQHKSLLVDLVEGFAKLGWNLEYIDDRELNQRILLLWASAFAIQGEEDFLRRYAQRIGQPITDIVVAAQLAKKMKSREEFLKSREPRKQKADFITEWRLDSSQFIEKYYEVQELLRRRFLRAAQFIPPKEYVLRIPQREKVISARDPLESLVCYQQGELRVHLDYVWPKTVFEILSAFLEGRRRFNPPLPIFMKCLDKTNGLCVREGTTRECILDEKSSITKCPVLKKRAAELCDRLEKQLSYFKNAEKISSESSKVDWKEGEKKGTYHFHTDIVPFSR